MERGEEVLPPGLDLAEEPLDLGAEGLAGGDEGQGLDEVLGLEAALGAVLDDEVAGVGPGQGQVGLGAALGGEGLAQVLRHGLEVAGLQEPPGLLGGRSGPGPPGRGRPVARARRWPKAAFSSPWAWRKAS